MNEVLENKPSQSQSSQQIQPQIIISTDTHDNILPTTLNQTKPKGILKNNNSKYSKEIKNVKSYSNNHIQVNKKKSIVKDIVLERKNPKADAYPNNNSFMDVEGYQPCTTTNMLQKQHMDQNYTNMAVSSNTNTSVAHGNIIANEHLTNETPILTSNKKKESNQEINSAQRTPQSNIKKSKPKIRSISELISQQEKLSKELSILNIKDTENFSNEKVVEAEVTFSYMSSQQYKEQQEKQLKEQAVKVKPSDKVISEENVVNELESIDIDKKIDTKEYDDDSEIFDFFLKDNEDEDEETVTKPKPFITLWSVLSTWITPQAIQLLQHWKQPESKNNLFSSNLTNDQNQNDISISRYKGLISILELYLPQCWKIVTHIIEKSIIEKKLYMLITYFDYNQSMPNFLDSDLWKCLIIVLIHIVSGEDKVCELDFVKEVGLAYEEYVYLIQRSFNCFVEDE